jgi:hypothetical protein
MPQAGVNRAYPYARFDDDKLEAHGTALFRIAHNPNFNLAIQALQLVFQVTHFICLRVSVCVVCGAFSYFLVTDISMNCV